MKKILNKNFNFFYSKNFLVFILYSVLFFPEKLIYEYFLILFVLSLSINYFNGLQKSMNLYSKLIFFSMISITFSSILSYFYYQTSLLRNLSEVFRFLPSFLILNSRTTITLELKNFLKVIVVYSCSNAVVCLLQYYLPQSVDMLTNFYGSAHHVTTSLNISKRALGLCSGPGQNGVIMVATYVIGLTSLLYFKESKKIEIFIIFSSLISILLSQSQTSFIAFVAVSLYIFIYNLIKSRLTIRGIITIMSLLVCAGSIVGLLWQYLRYLNTLYSIGLKRSSYVLREQKTLSILEKTQDNFFFTMIGHGKDFFGKTAGSMDNEYMFFVGSYGLLLTTIFIIIVLHMILKAWLIPLEKQDRRFILLHFLAVVGLLLAWPSSFITDPRILMLLTIIACIGVHKNIITLTEREI